ncbi:HpcH/HpaI aldolase/citrate lyase family protein [Streptomyces sp. NPDC004721]
MSAASGEATGGSPARSHLYVPGDRADLLTKAFTRGADALIVDLEDAVAPAAKETARDTVADWLTDLGTPPIPVWVRINAGDERAADVAAVAGLASLTGLCVAKTDAASELAALDRELTLRKSSAWLAPLIESARGVLAAPEIAAAPRVALLHLGEIDLAADVALTPGPDAPELLFARSQVVFASRAARIGAPVAPVSADLGDPARYRATTAALKRLGFFGRACIHPGQVTVANEVFTPTETELRWAHSLLEQFADAAAGVFRDSDGNMVDEAVVRRARHIATLAGHTPADAAPPAL